MSHVRIDGDIVYVSAETWHALDALRKHKVGGDKPGNHVWDEWERLALSLGVEASTAALGSEVMREFYQHDWKKFGSEVSKKAVGTMLALVDPEYADARWSYLLETDGEWRKRAKSEPFVTWEAT